MKLSRKKLFAGIGAGAIMLLATAGLTSANFGGLMDEDTRDQLKTAEENKDYDSWKSIQDSVPEITDYIDSQEDFEKFIEMNEAYKSGETETGDAIRDELGLPENFRPGQGNKNGQGGQKGPNEEEKAALDSGDYNAWLEAVPEDSPILEFITSEADFQKLVEMHEAKEAGDDETAKAIADELGLPEKGGQNSEGGPEGQNRPNNEEGRPTGNEQPTENS